MISIKTYQIKYPLLAQFAKEDPTYIRRSKTGKRVIVRKGKRRKGYNRAVSGVGGLLAGNAAIGIAATGIVGGLRGLVSKADSNPAFMKKLNKAAVPIAIGAYGATLAAGAGAGYTAYKYLRGDRGRRKRT